MNESRKAILIVCLICASLAAQPKSSRQGVMFTYKGSAKRVALAGDFNSWQKEKDYLKLNDSGVWTILKQIPPGLYQYKFFIDGLSWVLDEANPARTQNFNNSGENSVFFLTEEGTVLLVHERPNQVQNKLDEYPQNAGTLYLNIIWHQHQPLYLDPGTDQLKGPWVRTHATKDYYDMVAMVGQYPNVHVTVNLTSSLLYQLQEFYVNRLKPFIDLKRNHVNAQAYFENYGGKTDPWIDLALKPTKDFNTQDIRYLLTNQWNAFGISEVIIARFPHYKALKAKFLKDGTKAMTEQDKRELKFFFYLANYDPDFLEKRVQLTSQLSINLTDIVKKQSDGTYVLTQVVTEDLCNRMIAETYKILASVIPAHRKLLYDNKTGKGQVEIITTPFYHPILPLIYDSDLAKICQPQDKLPRRYHFPEDAEAQIIKSVKFYNDLFGIQPSGMWPGEGSVAYEVLPLFRKNGIQWVATDEKILSRSKPEGQPKYYPYAVRQKEGSPTVVVFRDTELSDKIGFVYQNYRGEDAADDFIRHVLRYAPKEKGSDRLLTVILDGENAWEWYRNDNDGKEFLHALYRKLSKLFNTKQIVTATVTEFINGNSKRNLPAHPIDSLPALDWIHPGSWINANYDTWIGEREENEAWECLLTVRNDLKNSGLQPTDPQKNPPKKDSKEYYAYQAWESLYAAEGSDWFWWYGNDQNAGGGDKPFDTAFLTLISNVYRFAEMAGAQMPKRNFPPIILDTQSDSKIAQGAMAQSIQDMATVVFQVRTERISVRDAIYIAGNHAKVGDWKPNNIRMYNDGTHGDEKVDTIWTLELQLPVGFELEYKYTNSGLNGEWSGSEEFASPNRKITIQGQVGTKQIVIDDFGVKK
ncbi:MAG: carbohydrate-binding module family 20 domain-containing protein [bacterium]